MRFLWLSLALLTGCDSAFDEYCEERTDCLEEASEIIGESVGTTEMGSGE